MRKILCVLAMLAIAAPAWAGPIATAGNSVYRDFNVDGVPSSGVHNPDKAEIRALIAQIETAIGAGGGGGGSGAASLSIVWHRITPVSSGTTFSIGAPLTAKQVLIVLLNGAPQPQGTAFSVSGSTVTFLSAGVTTADTIDYAILTVA